MERRAPSPTQAPHAKVPRAEARAEAPASSAFPLHALPRDLLPLILLRLPRDHRLRHASRVCKAWRALILSNTGELKVVVDARPRRFDELISFLPALTSLHLCINGQSPREIVMQLRPSLTSLRLAVDRFNVTLRILPPYPSLTHLSYDFDQPSPLDALVAASVSSLRSLETLLLAPIRDIRLPALTSLAVKKSRHAPEIDFLLAHSTQLHRLSLRHIAVGFLIHISDLPRLTSLACLHPPRGVWYSVLAPVARLRLRHTALRRLAVVCSHADCPPDAAPDVAALVAPVLTSLDITADMTARFRTECLPLFTRLDRLALPVEAHAAAPPPALPSHCAAALQHLALALSGRRGRLAYCTLARFPRVASLALHGVPKDWPPLLTALPADLALPCLTTLHISGVKSYAAAAEVVARFRSAAPRLRKVLVHPQPPPLPQQTPHAELQALCEACAGLGVLRLRPHSRRTISEQTAAYLRALPLRVLLSKH